MDSIKTEVESLVNELARNRKIFTAYDVTCILRDKFDGEKISHNEVKKEVHALFESDKMGIYERGQKSLGGKTSPFIYHLNHQNIDTDYDKDWVSGYLTPKFDLLGNPVTSSSPKIKRIATPAPSVTPTASVTSDPSVTPAIQVVNSNNIANRVQSLSDGFQSVPVTAEGRLCIPTKLLKDISGKAFISIIKTRKDGYNVDALAVSENPNPQTIISYSINNDGRLRISPKFLRRVGSAKSYAVKDMSSNLGHKVIVVVPE